MVDEPKTITLKISDPVAEKNYQKISISGEVDRDTINSFRDQIDDFLKSFNSGTLILDFASLEFVNSEGIGYLTDVYNRLTALNKKIMIVNASERILDIFQLVGLTQIIPCFPSEEECINNL